MNDIDIPGGGVDQNSSNAIIPNFATIGGFTATAFSGILDGNGYMVSNLFLNSDGGLFFDVTGTIRNLNVHAVVSSGNQGNYGSIGGIANLVNGGLIENCQFDGQVILQKTYGGSEPDGYAVGGIAGRVQSGKTKIVRITVMWQSHIMSGLTALQCRFMQAVLRVRTMDGWMY